MLGCSAVKRWGIKKTGELGLAKHCAMPSEQTKDFIEGVRMSLAKIPRPLFVMFGGGFRFLLLGMEL